jgi:hypothetical protein
VRHRLKGALATRLRLWRVGHGRASCWFWPNLRFDDLELTGDGAPGAIVEVHSYKDANGRSPLGPTSPSESRSPPPARRGSTGGLSSTTQLQPEEDSAPRFGTQWTGAWIILSSRVSQRGRARGSPSHAISWIRSAGANATVQPLGYRLRQVSHIIRPPKESM